MKCCFEINFSGDGCSAPPQVEHAVVINYDYQDSFDEKTTVVYKCKESYEMSGSSDSICEEGVWSKPGFCGKVQRDLFVCVCPHYPCGLSSL